MQNVPGWAALMMAAGLILSGCMQKKEQRKLLSNFRDSTDAFRKFPEGNADTLDVSGKSAVFFNADSLQWDRFRLAEGDVAYQGTSHDCFYQMRNARQELMRDWKEVEIWDGGDKRYVRFFIEHGDPVVVDLDTKEMCGLILFDGIGEPLFADMMNISTDLYRYFGPRTIPYPARKKSTKGK